MSEPAGGGAVRDPRLALVDGFVDYLGHQRRLAEGTRSNYARDLETLLALVPGLPLERFESHTIRRAVVQLASRGLAGRSLARTLSAWRGFFGWLVRYRGLPSNPCVGVRAPRAPKALPKALSPDAAGQLLDAPATTPMERRDQAMFELCYSSGLRLAELVGLSIDEARAILRDGEVTVTGKGQKTRVVPVGERAKQSIGDWLAVRGELAKPGEAALFVGARGDRINPRVVRARLEGWAVRAGLGVHVHPHVLRHSFATHVLQSSGDLRAVQEMLGHSRISTTQVYTALDFQHLAKVYDAAHPRAKRKK